MTAARHSLRLELRARRANLRRALRRAASSQIIRRIQRHPAYRRARTVALYHAMATELDLSPLVHRARAAGKTVLLPRVTGDSMHFAYYEANTPLVRGPYGIAQPPAGAKRALLMQIDLVIAPLIGFDDSGQRLGQGGGYYDRVLARRLCSPVRVPFAMGAAFAVQRCPPLAAQAWDVAMDVVIHDTISDSN